jgi:NAD(P)-dependent dehydrogenase (short-subunit alcohol dehydrogenase family)
LLLSGLGESTVRRLVKEKANVAIVDVNNERGNALVQELGKSTLFVNADITNEGIFFAFLK